MEESDESYRNLIFGTFIRYTRRGEGVHTEDGRTTSGRPLGPLEISCDNCTCYVKFNYAQPDSRAADNGNKGAARLRADE